MQAIMVMAVSAGLAGLAGGGKLARAEVPAGDHNRIGINGVAEFGPFASYGGSVRFEHRVGRFTWLGRAGMMRGMVVLDGGKDFEAAVLNVGFRRYFGARASEGAYVSLEAGAAAMRWLRYLDDDDHYHGIEWNLLPSGAAAVGGKIGQLDFGATLMLPFIGVGVYLGFDFAVW